MKVPKGIMLAAEMQVLANEVGRALGQDGPVAVHGITEADPFLPDMRFRVGYSGECLYSFTTEYTGDARWNVVGYAIPDGFAVVIVTDELFQGFPVDASLAYACPSRDEALKDYMAEVVWPFVHGLSSLKPGKFDAWLEDCRRKWKAQFGEVA